MKGRSQQTAGNRFRLGLRSVLLVLAAAMLFGCAPARDTSEELWVVTEQTTWDRMNGQTQVLMEQFAEAHPDVTVRLDILPTEEQERESYLQKLRTQILRGGGPDAYLLPTDGWLILDEPSQYNYVQVELLFEDVELAMRNGMFYDISSLYGEDEALDREELQNAVMDAGCLGEARYVLPLRYDMPVIYADPEELEKAGLDPAVLEKGIDDLMEALLTAGDPMLAAGACYEGFSAFSRLLDYETGEVELSQDTLCRYMDTYRRLRALAGEVLGSTGMDLGNYLWGWYDSTDPMMNRYVRRYPLHIGTMEDALTYAPVYRYEEKDLIMTPMRTVEGDVVATVTYYAAVGSGSDQPELAYEFLRLFLLEESQWEQNRPERSHTTSLKGVRSNASNDMQYPGLIETGWPVRSLGSVEELWGVCRRQNLVNASGETGQRIRKICRDTLEEERVPVLTAQIDQVRFNTTLSDEFEDTLSLLNDAGSGASMAVDIQQLADELIWKLRWHGLEG